jgi:uroporphyrinogen III methyltransferase/synthase
MKPLRGKRILITRPREQADELAARLEVLGAETLLMPTIQIVGPEDWSAVDRAIQQLREYDWLIFTSGNGVDHFCQRLKAQGSNISTKPKIGVVGRATAEKLAAWGWHADLIPEQFTAEGILQAFPENLSGMRFLFPRGNIARATLPEGLRQRGAVVDDVIVYRTLMVNPPDEHVMQMLESTSVDLVTFTSSSIVANFIRLIGEDQMERLKGRFLAASIGPKTSKTIREFGLRVDIEAPVSTVAALVEAIVAYFQAAGR